MLQVVVVVRTRLFTLLGHHMIGLAAFCGSFVPLFATAQNPPALKAPSLSTNGSMHEAFLSPAQDREPTYIDKAPPTPINEKPDVDPPSVRAVWISGYWSWNSDQKDFFWTTGTWRNPPPGRFWVNGCWKRDDKGWIRVSGFWSKRQTDRIDWRKTGPPDKHPSDVAGNSPGKEFFYVPGSYAPDGDGVIWTPGFWTKAQPGWSWVSALWLREPEGWVFKEGYWDRVLEDRGTLFTPAQVSQGRQADNLTSPPFGESAKVHRFSDSAIELLKFSSNPFSIDGQRFPSPTRNLDDIVRLEKSNDEKVALGSQMFHKILELQELQRSQSARTAKAFEDQTRLGIPAFLARLVISSLIRQDSGFGEMKEMAKTVESLIGSDPQREVNNGFKIACLGIGLVHAVKDAYKALAKNDLAPSDPKKSGLTVRLATDKDIGTIEISNRTGHALHNCMIFTRFEPDRELVRSKFMEQDILGRALLVALGFGNSVVEGSVEAGRLRKQILLLDQGVMVFVPELRAGATVKALLVNPAYYIALKKADISLWSDELIVEHQAAENIAAAKAALTPPPVTKPASEMFPLAALGGVPQTKSEVFSWRFSNGVVCRFSPNGRCQTQNSTGSWYQKSNTIHISMDGIKYQLEMTGNNGKLWNVDEGLIATGSRSD